MTASMMIPLHDRAPAHEAARLTALLTAAPAAIIELAPDATVRTWSAGAERLYGWRAAEVIGKPLPTAAPEEMVFVRKLIADTMSGSPLYQADARRTHKDGGSLDVCISTAPVEGADGTPDGIIAVVTDVTEHRWATRALEASERQYRAVTDGAPLGIAVLSADERFLFVNKKYESWFGLPREEIVGRPARELLGEPLHESVSPWVRRVLRGETVTFETAVTLRDGRVRQHQITYVPELSVDGTTSGFFSLWNDVTDQKRLEEQYRQAQKMEAVGQLAGGIAHDFNNLLTVILSHADFLQEAAAQAGLSDDARQMREAAQKAAQLTRQLLAVSKQQSLQPRDLDLNQVVHGMEQLLDRTMGDAIELRVDLHEPGAQVRADQGQVEQVLMNLVLNARDAMPQGGRLTIATERAIVGDPVHAAGGAADTPDTPDAPDAPDAPAGLAAGAYIRLSVRDTGLGIAREHQARLFEPFFTTKEPGQGTGLGLATVYGIVQQSGGQVSVVSEPGHGATFHVWLPESVPVPKAAAKAAVAPPPGGRETVLLVEDEPIVRVIARKSLERCGYSVLEAENGEEALRLARGLAGPIHLLLTDLIMPQMGGVILAQEFAKVRALTRVLFCTGYAGTELVQRGGLPANCGMIEKPFSPDSLARHVRQVLDSPIASPAVHTRRTKSA